jgi:glycosyltransferase domain-containing protein
MSPRLTVVMPLKGRHLFTFRFLWHANQMRLPYRFLLADGHVNDTVARRLEGSQKLFPELDIEYVRYPDDVDYGRLFAKMSDVSQRVRTPYAMMADNDDFLGFEGVERALDFLEANPDYVCARGRAVTFSIYSGLGGQYGSVSGKFNSFQIDGDDKTVAAPTVTERLRQGGLCNGVYYAIHRAEAFARVWREVAEINFSDLMLHEDFHALRVWTLGKLHTNKDSISYYSQSGTGISYQPQRDWARHLLRSQFTSDAHAVVERIASVAAEADGCDAAVIAEDVRTILESRYRNFLSMNYGAVAEIKRALHRKWPRLVRYLQTRPRLFVGRKRAGMFAQLRDAGANRPGLNKISHELAVIERALSRQAFSEFAAPFLPMAHNADSREWFYLGERAPFAKSAAPN